MSDTVLFISLQHVLYPKSSLFDASKYINKYNLDLKLTNKNILLISQEILYAFSVDIDFPFSHRSDSKFNSKCVRSREFNLPF